MRQATLEGIVLRKTLHNDTQLIVNLFSKTEGLIPLKIFLGKKEPLTLGLFELGHVLELDIVHSKTHFKVKGSQLLYSPLGIRKSLNRLQAFMQLIHKVAYFLEEGVSQPLFYEFFKNSLKAFEHHPDPHSLHKFILLKWMQHEGYIDINCSSLTNLSAIIRVKNFNEVSCLTQEQIDHIDHLIRIHLD